MTDRAGKPVVPDTYEHVTTREWLAHQRRADAAEAKCECLREQLDTARQALEEIAALDSPHVTGTAGADKCHVCVARAALGVEGRGGRQ